MPRPRNVDQALLELNLDARYLAAHGRSVLASEAIDTAVLLMSALPACELCGQLLEPISPAAAEFAAQHWCRRRGFQLVENSPSTEPNDASTGDPDNADNKPRKL